MDYLGTKSFLRSDRRTVTQLLAAAEKDTDRVSVFMSGCTVADTEAAIFVVKGAEHIAYLRALCERQGLLTDKPVVGIDASTGL
jgi:thiamine biosynthesis lipoprotein ApbE